MLVCIHGVRMFSIVRTTIAIKKLFLIKSTIVVFIFTVIFTPALVATVANAGSIRDHTRPNYTHSTRVNESQAAELTLTLVPVASQNLQTWLRLAGVIDSAKRYLSAIHCTNKKANNPAVIQIGQRIRAFTPDSKSSIFRATVISVAKSSNNNVQQQCILITARLSATTKQANKNYIMEIIVQRGQYKAIPKEAIIEEHNSHIVYLQKKSGQFIPRKIKTGLKGELYTEVITGLELGEQVVTLGSFFIDAQYKLSLAQKSGTADAHHHH